MYCKFLYFHTPYFPPVCTFYKLQIGDGIAPFYLANPKDWMAFYPFLYQDPPLEDGIEETLTYCDFPGEHWTRIRTNNVIERLNRENRPRTRVVGSFLDGNSALMLVCARLRHVAGTQWGNKKYMNMKRLEVAVEDASIAG